MNRETPVVSPWKKKIKRWRIKTHRGIRVFREFVVKTMGAIVAPVTTSVKYIAWRLRGSPLNEEQKQRLLEQPSCDHCGGYHAIACPRVKRMKFHKPDATLGVTIEEIEFWETWPKDQIIFIDIA